MSTTLGLIGLGILLWAWIWFAGCDAAFNDYDDPEGDDGRGEGL